MRQPRLLTHQGFQDGIRWGELVLSDGSRRRYVHDRLNGKVRLWVLARIDPRLDETDNDPGRNAEALRLVEQV